MRKEDGSLHFFVNSTDLGCAAQGVPPDVYGVVDLFGQCAQVTIISGMQENGDSDIITNTLNGKNKYINSKNDDDDDDDDSGYYSDDNNDDDDDEKKMKKRRCRKW